jgi:hypothetical protein
MMIRFEFVRGADGLRELLRANGWKLEDPVAGTLYATHPEVGDQPAARSRLHELGVLTSAQFRIEFVPFRKAGVG